MIPNVKYTAADLDISIFPNPMTDYINIDNQGSETIESYRLIANDGSIILSKEISSVIKVDDYPVGIYNLELTMKSGVKAVSQISIVR